MTYEEFLRTHAAKYLKRTVLKDGTTLFADLFYIYKNGFAQDTVKLYKLWKKKDFIKIRDTIYFYGDETVSFLTLLDKFLREKGSFLHRCTGEASYENNFENSFKTHEELLLSKPFYKNVQVMRACGERVSESNFLIIESDLDKIWGIDAFQKSTLKNFTYKEFLQTDVALKLRECTYQEYRSQKGQYKVHYDLGLLYKQNLASELDLLHTCFEQRDFKTMRNMLEVKKLDDEACEYDAWKLFVSKVASYILDPIFYYYEDEPNNYDFYDVCKEFIRLKGCFCTRSDDAEELFHWNYTKKSFVDSFDSLEEFKSSKEFYRTESYYCGLVEYYKEELEQKFNIDLSDFVTMQKSERSQRHKD
jgi:hypothetical protein